MSQSLTTWAPDLACPRCHAPLQAEGDSLRCADHGTMARLGSQGVLEFEDDSVYWGEIERDRMRQVNAAAHQVGWREALKEHLRPDRAGFIP